MLPSSLPSLSWQAAESDRGPRSHRGNEAVLGGTGAGQGRRHNVDHTPEIFMFSLKLSELHWPYRPLYFGYIRPRGHDGDIFQSHSQGGQFFVEVFLFSAGSLWKYTGFIYLYFTFILKEGSTVQVFVKNQLQKNNNTVREIVTALSDSVSPSTRSCALAVTTPASLTAVQVYFPASWAVT